MAMTRSLLFSLALSVGLCACGARTSFYDPADYPDGFVPSDATDVTSPDVPGDAPGPDVPSVCGGGLAMCRLGCTSLSTDARNCGRCDNVCASGRTCVAGVCAVVQNCNAPLLTCNGTCVDPRSNTSNCGGCGRTCLGGAACVNSACISSCPTPAVICGGVCVDPRIDIANCGRCGQRCATGQTCRNGACVGTCGLGQTLCSGVCTDITSSALNCGGCGVRCGVGQSCMGSRCMTVAPLTYPEFRVGAYGADNCRTVEHNGVTGDDRGGIALTAAGVMYTGDGATGFFDAETLTARPLGVQLQALLSDLRTDRVYSLATGGVVISAPGRVDSLVELNPITGSPMGVVRLSAPIVLGGSVGFFSGYGRLAVETETQVFDINPVTGVVTGLGMFSQGMHNNCETWGFWGVAETIRGELWLDYVENSSGIVRRRASTGELQSISRFMSLSDMCSFTVSPSRQRWYFHHEGASQFRSGDETLGFCDATTSAFTASRYTTGPSPATWVDACAAPGSVHELPNTDDNFIVQPLSFGFRYWGETMPAGSLVNITSNGWMGINIPMNASLGGMLPSLELPNGVIAPYWGDNFTRDPGVCIATVGAAPNRRYVVEWNDQHFCCTDDPAVHLTYEAILNETTDAIDFLYNDMRGARPQIVGLEDSMGTQANVICNAPGSPCPAVATGARIRFTPSP